MIEVAESQIDRLLDRLLMAQQELKSVSPPGADEPLFVLVAKDGAARLQIEMRMMEYFARKYGFDISKKLPYELNPLETVSMFKFPQGVKISVIEFK